MRNFARYVVRGRVFNSASNVCPAVADIDAALHQVSYNDITGNVKFDTKGDRAQFAMVGFKIVGGKFTPTWKLTGTNWVAYS